MPIYLNIEFEGA